MARCEICNKESTDRFCRYHKLAYESLLEGYKIWKEAYDELSWKDYLTKILKIKHSGKWVKEVAYHELEGLFKAR